MALGTRHPAQERSKKIASTTVFLGRLTGSPPLCTIGCAPMLTLMLDPASRRTVRPAVVTTAALTAAAPAAAPQLSLVVASSRVTSRVVAESRVLVAHQWLHDGWHCGRSECAAQGTCDVLVQRRVVLVCAAEAHTQCTPCSSIAPCATKHSPSMDSVSECTPMDPCVWTCVCVTGTAQGRPGHLLDGADRESSSNHNHNHSRTTSRFFLPTIEQWLVTRRCGSNPPHAPSLFPKPPPNLPYLPRSSNCSSLLFAPSFSLLPPLSSPHPTLKPSQAKSQVPSQHFGRSDTH